MKPLLTLTALFEGLTGVALVVAPGIAVMKVLGMELHEPGEIALARMAGLGLMALAAGCWRFRSGPWARTMVLVMLGYNLLATALLLYLGLVVRSNAQGLWPAVALHMALLLWCIAALRKPLR